MDTLKIALLQIAPCGTLAGNLEKEIASCRKAKAVPADSKFVSSFGGLAKELDMAIATCNYPGSAPDCNGGSSVFDGVAYLPELDGSRDTCILQAGGAEGIYLTELVQLRRYRESGVHSNTFRRPQKYGLLRDAKIEPPFSPLNIQLRSTHIL